MYYAHRWNRYALRCGQRKRGSAPIDFAKRRQRRPEEGRSDPCGYQGLLRRADARPQTRDSTVRNVLLCRLCHSAVRTFFFSCNLKVAVFISISVFKGLWLVSVRVHGSFCQRLLFILYVLVCKSASCVYLPLRHSHSKVKLLV